VFFVCNYNDDFHVSIRPPLTRLTLGLQTTVNGKVVLMLNCAHNHEDA
jgi:hypothetical protein